MHWNRHTEKSPYMMWFREAPSFQSSHSVSRP